MCQGEGCGVHDDGKISALFAFFAELALDVSGESLSEKNYPR